MDALGLKPDLVVLSPLSRAADTGRAFLARHPELTSVTETWASSHEMAFGDWDNVMVKDIPDDHIAHLFYLAQNAVVKAAKPYPGPYAPPEAAPIENFVEVSRTGHARRLCVSLASVIVLPLRWAPCGAHRRATAAATAAAAAAATTAAAALFICPH